jgi:hypothetical protein
MQPAIHARARARSAGRVALPALCAAVLALALPLAACRPHPGTHAAQEKTVSRPSIAEALARHTPAWMALPGVVGTYEGADAAGSPVIVVMIAREDAALRARIPSTCEGWPVRVEVTGEIKARGDSAR